MDLCEIEIKKIHVIFLHTMVHESKISRSIIWFYDFFIDSDKVKKEIFPSFLLCIAVHLTVTEKKAFIRKVDILLLWLWSLIIKYVFSRVVSTFKVTVV